MSDGEIGRSVRSDEQTGSRVSSGERPRLSGGHQRDVAFVALLRADDPSAFGLLFDTWIDPIYDRISHRSFTTADVAELSAGSFAATHRRIVEQSTDDPFRVVLFRSARQETVAAADRRVDLHMPVGPYAEDRLVRGADANGLATDPAVAALLWQAADVLGDQARDVLDLHHRHEFSPVEVAAVMNLAPEAVEDILLKVPKGLTAVVRSMVVWRQGNPTHDELGAVLAGSNGFDTTTVRTIAEHQRTCETCREAGKLSVDPLAVFKAIPLAVAPVGFKEIVIDRLHEGGLPIEGSVSYRPGADRNGNGAAAAAGVVGLGAGAASAAALASTSDAGPSVESAASEASAPGVDAPSSEPVGSDVDDDDLDDESGSPWDPLVRPASTASSDRDKAKAKAAIAATAAAAAAAAVAAGATDAAAEEVASTSAMGSGSASGSGSGSPSVLDATSGSGSAMGAGSTSGSGSALGAAGTGAFAADAASSPAYAPSPAPAPGSSSEDDGSGSGSGSNRKLLYVGIAVAAVILLIGGFLLTQGGSKDKSSLTSAAPSSSTTVSTTASSSSSSLVTTTVPVTGETTPPDTGSTDTSLTPTTKGPQATITVPGQVVTTTTAVPFPNMNGTTMVLSTNVVTSGVGQAPTLSWNVVSDKPVTVTITGPNLSSTDLSGGPRPVCPGTIESGGACTADNGTYSYVMKATDSEGRQWWSKTVQFTVHHN